VCVILYLIQQEDIKVSCTSQFPPGLRHVLSRLGVTILKGMEYGLFSGLPSCYAAMDCCEHDWNFATVRPVQQLSAVRTILCVIVSVSSRFFTVTGSSTQRSRICVRLWGFVLVFPEISCVRYWSLELPRRVWVCVLRVTLDSSLVWFDTNRRNVSGAQCPVSRRRVRQRILHSSCFYSQWWAPVVSVHVCSL